MAPSRHPRGRGSSKTAALLDSRLRGNDKRERKNQPESVWQDYADWHVLFLSVL